MTTFERHNKLLELISLKRHTTVAQLAQEIGVSKRTVQRDIELLSLEYPLVTTIGRGGGVSFMDGCYYSKPKFYISDLQKKVLTKIINQIDKTILTDEELEALKKLVKEHSRKN